MKRRVIVVGGGISGLSAASYLSHKGYHVDLFEKLPQLGGRMNIMRKGGYTFDVGPSFLTMTYVYRNFFSELGADVDEYFSMVPLDPQYTVHWKDGAQVVAYRDMHTISSQLRQLGEQRVGRFIPYLLKGKRRFESVFENIINTNSRGMLDYISMRDFSLLFDGSMTRSMWSELSREFTSPYTKTLLSLDAFFLGMSPYDAPSLFSLLNYTDLQHDGIWRVEGGMYNMVKGYVRLAREYGVRLHTGKALEKVNVRDGKVTSLVIDGERISADAYVVTMDYMTFFTQYLNAKYGLDTDQAHSYKHSMAPFTMYLGAAKKFPNSDHHNYIIGENFSAYLSDFFGKGIIPENPYYYVTNSSRYDTTLAPKGHTSLFVLVPVPNLRTDIDWKKKSNAFSQVVLEDLEKYGFAGLKKSMRVCEVLSPIEWRDTYSLFEASGLGLMHNLRQLGPLRPKNYHPDISNLFFAGASTTPGTGIPMVTISGRLAGERVIEKMQWN